MVGHIYQTHMFQGRQLPIASIGQFAVCDSMDCACFTDKGAPFGDIWKPEPGAVLAAADKRGANRKALGVIGAATWSGLGAIPKRESSVRKVTMENPGINGEAKETAHAPMSPVPCATSNWREGQRVPTCPW
jgi:hypothetical protein